MNLEVERVVSREGFTRGEVRDCGLICWRPKYGGIRVSNVSEGLKSLCLIEIL